MWNMRFSDFIGENIKLGFVIKGAGLHFLFSFLFFGDRVSPWVAQNSRCRPGWP